MKQSKIHETWEKLSKQMDRLLTCNKSEMDNEVKRSKSLSDLANSQAAFAEHEAKMFLAGGFLPENSLIAVPDDAKLLRKSNYAESKKKPTLLDEFVKS